MSSWLGIDFSGNHLMWNGGRRNSNIWVATVNRDAGRYQVAHLRIVQDLPGSTPPFDRLVALLNAGAYDTAAIDAPFSLPAAYVGGGHSELLQSVATCELERRPFPRAAALLERVAPDLLPRGRHIFRETERYWRDRGVNTRSTLWAGPRGGAAMTAACLLLLQRAQRPIWPWCTTDQGPRLVEAFPAAQLRTWGLPHQKYNGTDHQAQLNRERIVENLAHRITFGEFKGRVINSADALDAVVAAFAGIAVTEGRLAVEPGTESAKEGWIAVHRVKP